MVDGMVLPESYGPFAVSRGNEKTRLITLRNLSWNPVTYKVQVGAETGLGSGDYSIIQFHPEEKFLGKRASGKAIDIQVEPFRSCLVLLTSEPVNEPVIEGMAYEVVENVEGKPIRINLLGKPGTTETFSIQNASAYQSLQLGDGKANSVRSNKKFKVSFSGSPLTLATTRLVGTFSKMQDIQGFDWKPLYEATVFSADNNALEVRSIQRSGWSQIPEVLAAQQAFFEQKTFRDRGLWDRNLFDGDMETAFWQSKKYNRDQSVKGGCFRLDLGSITDLDQLVIKTRDNFSLEPLLEAEGNYVEISDDLIHWIQLTYLAGTTMTIDLPQPTRYLRFRSFPSQINEIEGFKNGRSIDRSLWKASNLFAYPDDRKLACKQVWTSEFTLSEIAPNSYLCVALNGVHGVEGAYVAAKIDGKLTGAPDRAQSYPSNTWEYINSQSDKNYTYYIPLHPEDINKRIEVFILGFEEEFTDFNPEVWIHAYPVPYQKLSLELVRK